MQTRFASFVESWANIFVGFSINYCANLLIFPLFGFHISLKANVVMGAIYTSISLARSYTLRRWFNGLKFGNQPINPAAKIFAWFILWAIARTRQPLRVVTFAEDTLFWRYEFLWPDEWCDSIWDNARKDCCERPNKLPWWRPFNAFVHRWCPSPELRESVHDHPRWSITLCLRGQIIEHTPWGSRRLKPGSIVFRSHKAIHSFEVPQGFRGKTWTLFIVGRRKHRQNTYVVTPQ